MDLNPFDDAADYVGDEVGKAKKKLVKYLGGRVGKNAPVRGTGNRKPRYYTNSGKSPFRRP